MPFSDEEGVVLVPRKMHLSVLASVGAALVAGTMAYADLKSTNAEITRQHQELRDQFEKELAQIKEREHDRDRSRSDLRRVIGKLQLDLALLCSKQVIKDGGDPRKECATSQ